MKVLIWFVWEQHMGMLGTSMWKNSNHMLFGCYNESGISMGQGWGRWRWNIDTDCTQCEHLLTFEIFTSVFFICICSSLWPKVLYKLVLYALQPHCIEFPCFIHTLACLLCFTQCLQNSALKTEMIWWANIELRDQFCVIGLHPLD
jgi:hypothetical protein